MRRPEDKDDCPGPILKPATKIECQPGLPICEAWNDILEALSNHQVVMVTGDTGSGKSTQLPKICLAAGRGGRAEGGRRPRMIGVTQPRRIAATSIARRLRQELAGVLPADAVGYKIRFRDQTGRGTRIKVMTDGILLAEMQSDRLLSAYDTIIVDEAHERSLNIDFILGLLKQILPKRPDLKLVITSATMDTERLAAAFGDPPIIPVEGRTHPVEILYRPYDHLPDSDDLTVVDKAILAVEEIRQIDRFGDILVFLPTEAEIHQMVKTLKGRLGPDLDNGAVEVLPLYGRLNTAAQERIFKPFSGQKILVSTNIAETSITVPGIRYVVDSGLARISTYNVSTHTKALPVTRISKASAAQRAGRAGRVEAGLCIRLYSQEDFEDREEFTPPEILRTNLAEVVLRLAAMGQDPLGFPFVDSPSLQAIKEARHTLFEVGAIKTTGSRGDAIHLTHKGRRMARLPLDPRISAVILQARQEGCLPAALVIAAALSIQDVRQYPAEKEEVARQAHASFRDDRSDFLTLLSIWNAFNRLKAQGASTGRLRRFCKRSFLSWNRMNEWSDLVAQLAEIVSEMEQEGSRRRKAGRGRPHATLPWPRKVKEMIIEDLDDEAANRLHRSILAGFLGNLAVKKEQGHGYRGAKGKEIHIFPGSVLFKSSLRWIVSAEQVRTSRLFARFVAPVEPQWAEELGSHICKRGHGEPWWSQRRGEAMVLERVTLYGLPVVEARRKGLKAIDPLEARKIFLREGLAGHKLGGRYRFLRHNTALLAQIEEIEQKTRSRQYLADHEVIEKFYTDRLMALEKAWGRMITDEASFRRALRVTGMEEEFFMTREILLKQTPAGDALEAYPGSIEIGGVRFELSYTFAPGDERDGITCKIPVTALPHLEPEPFEWLVPGMLQEKVEFILKNLPKAARKKVVPVPETAERLCSAMPFRQGGLFQAMEEALARMNRGIPGLASMAANLPYPDHLLMRFEIIDAKGRGLGAGRNLAELKDRFASRAASEVERHPRWKSERRRWEREIDPSGPVPELPERILLGKRPEIFVYPGLEVTQGPAGKTNAKADTPRVRIRLFTSEEEARASTLHAMRRMLANRLKKEFRQVERQVLCGYKGLAANLRRNLMTLLEAILADRFLSPEKAGFCDLDQATVKARKEMAKEASRLAEQAQKALEATSQVKATLERLGSKLSRFPSGRRAFQEVEGDLALLIPQDFPNESTLVFMEDIPRFAKGLITRLERAAVAPMKDASKAKGIEPLTGRVREILSSRRDASPEIQGRMIAALMELELQTFAPELFRKGSRPAAILEKLLARE